MEQPNLGWCTSYRLGRHSFTPHAAPGPGREELGISVGAFGGGAFHSNEDMKINTGDNGFHIHGTVNGVTPNDSGTFGGKLTAWYLPGKYRWQTSSGIRDRLHEIHHGSPSPI
jgi:hypothetical protein